MLEWLAVLLFITICLANAALLGNISRIIGPHKPSSRLHGSVTWTGGRQKCNGPTRNGCTIGSWPITA